MQRVSVGVERSDVDTVACQARALREDRLLGEVLAALPNMVVVLNDDRQVVFANEAVRAFTAASATAAPEVGRRPGEVLGCENASLAPGGCGCSEACRSCGVLTAIMQALGGEESRQEAHLTLASGRPLELEARSRPVVVNDERMVVLTLSDIAHLKRRRALERTFFHDVLNTAGGIQGLADILEDAEGPEGDTIRTLLVTTARQLVDEIESHRLLSATEADDYVVRRERLAPDEILGRAAAAQTSLARSRGVEIVALPWVGGDVALMSDPVLLNRVVGNLTKNAVEASSPGQVVRLSATREGDDLAFRVHNESAMPRDVQLQLFKRSFSTKGEGRGLGTYSVKLFTEKYLEGEVDFESSSAHGTVFRVAIPLQG